MFGLSLRRPVLAIAGAGALLLSGVALAGGRHGPPDPEQRAAFVKKAVDDARVEIEATPEQAEAIGVIVDNSLAQMDGLHERRQALHEAFKAALDSDAERATFEDLRSQAVALFDETSQIALDQRFDVKDVLTAEQIEELKSIRGGHALLGPPMFGHHGPPGGHGRHGPPDAEDGQGGGDRDGFHKGHRGRHGGERGERGDHGPRHGGERGAKPDAPAE